MNTEESILISDAEIERVVANMSLANNMDMPDEAELFNVIRQIEEFRLKEALFNLAMKGEGLLCIDEDGNLSLKKATIEQQAHLIAAYTILERSDEPVQSE